MAADKFVGDITIDPLQATRDDIDLMKTGHKPVMKRNYSFMSILAFAFMTVIAYVGIMASMGSGINSGGTVMLIYGTLLCTFFTVMVCLSLAELAGSYPTAGGQYHWTAVLSPEKWGPFLSWVCGYVNTFCITVGVSSVTVACAQFITGMAALAHPTYEVKQWHVFLIFEAIALLAFTVSVLGRRFMPLFNTISLFIAIAGFFVINITLLGTAHPKNSAKFVFATFTNETGWENDGIAFLVGLVSPAFSYSGLDAPVHLIEELRDAKKVVPRVIMLTVAIGFVTMFITTIVVAFCIVDLESILSTSTGVPIIQIFYNATNNVGASCFLTFIMLYSFTVATFTGFQVANRVVWAFSRDNGLPLSRFFSQVHPGLGVPLNAAILCWAIIAVLGCIYLGSTTAFGALAGCNALLTMLSYSFPIGLLLFGRRKFMEPSSFPLGSLFGPIVNGLAFAYIVFMFVFFDFPYVMPVTQDNMNYSAAVISAVFLLSFVLWFVRGRKVYTGPKVEISSDEVYAVELKTEL